MSSGGRSSLGTLFRYELKMLLRDRRTLFISVLLPLIILPVWIGVMRLAEEQAEGRRDARIYEYAVVGSWADSARTLIDEALALPAGPGSAADDPLTSASPTAAAFREVHPLEPDSALVAGELAFVVEAFTAEEAEAIRDSTREARRAEARRDAEGRGLQGEELAAAVEAARESLTEPEDGPPVPMIRTRYRGNSESSNDGADRLRDLLRDLRQDRRHAVYRQAGLPVDPGQLALVELDEMASPERESGAQMALWLTPILLLLMLSGGSIVAADAISGEKERGTLETLLTTSVRRSEIVTAKQLMIIVVGLAIAVINVANIALYLGLGLFELPDRFVISVEPLAVLLLLLLFLPMTLFISSVLLMLSGYAKSYKEYQVYFFPVLIAFMLPSMAAVLPGLELASVIAVVPIANISVAVREVLTGEYDWPFLALTIGSVAAVAAWLARLTERTLSTERLISGAELDEADLRGGAALFPRHVIRWFGVLWVVFFLSSLWFVGDFGIRGQILYNVVGLFLGASLLMMWRYRLDPREALALRMPKPAVWLGVLIGTPSALITGIGLSQFGQLIFPVPERLLEGFGQFMLPEQLPLWQVIVFLAVLPGICEEIAFRGVLLHGLRKRFRPVLLAVVVGAIFGFFHVDLFRLIPVTYLGIILAGVTLATGSIFPAMLWHALNNAAALVPSYLEWWEPGAEMAVWMYPAAVLGLVLAIAIIWRNRTPYPGLRSDEAPR